MEYICKPFKGSRKITYRLVEGVLSIDNGTKIPLERIESLQTIFFLFGLNYKAIVRSNTSKIVIHGINWIKGEKFIEGGQVDKFVKAIKQNTSHKYTIIEGSFPAYITKWALRIFVWLVIVGMWIGTGVLIAKKGFDLEVLGFLIGTFAVLYSVEELLPLLALEAPRKYSSI